MRDVIVAFARPGGSIFVVGADDERTGVIDLEVIDVATGERSTTELVSSTTSSTLSSR